MRTGVWGWAHALPGRAASGFGRQHLAFGGLAAGVCPSCRLTLCTLLSFWPADRTHVLELGSTATVADVKAAIEARQGELATATAPGPCGCCKSAQ